jgi:primosomal protein N' (replication factor Y)
MRQYAAVSVDVPVLGVSRVYHYSVPEDLRDELEVGAPVLVPFGPRKARGYILEFVDSPGVDEVRPILGRLRVAVVTPNLMVLAGDVARRYLCQVGEVLRCMVPPERRSMPHDMWEALPSQGKYPARQARLLEVLARHTGPVSGRLACREAGVPREVLLALEQKGLATRVTCVEEPPKDRAVVPTPAQAAAAMWASEALEGGVSLLFGVTGSGKTHIYLDAVERVVDQGRQAIFLVPEISLTLQAAQVFQDHFPGRVALMHSRITPGERFDEWARVREGRASVVVGARSAVFAPCASLGLIIVDEEHETTYKQEEAPRYHAREVALMRCGQEGAGVLLGSATPSVESYHRALRGGYRLFCLEARPLGRPMPRVHVADMREELRSGNRTIFSALLKEDIQDTLARREQVILFLNRRGHSTFMLCRECGFVMRCPSCDVSLTLHTEGRALRCHYCQHTALAPDTCPKCQGHYLRAFGTGTQRVEEEAKKAFPSARVLRMDTDSTARKGSHQRILSAFQRGEADILVGTQMIAKGLDIERVTLVGAMAADTALHLPDFRSAERTFQLLTQAAGRAGRGEREGRVIIQTYNPEHYSIEAARHHDYPGFFAREIASREDLGYPPFRELAQITCDAVSEDAARGGAEALACGVKYNGGLEILGPSPAPIAKVKGRYRWILVVKAQNAGVLSVQLGELLARAHGKGWPRGVRVTVDVDPASVL